MNEQTQRKIFNYLLKNNIQDFIGVPDSTMKHFINEGFKKDKVLITTREEEAIGIGVGISLTKNPTLIFMQNAGFANSISTITSLVLLYKIPIIFLIGWRGFLKNDAPEHTAIGQSQPNLLKEIKLQSKVLTETNWKSVCDWALSKNAKGQPCAIVIRRDFLD